MTFTPGKDRIEYGGAMIGQAEKDAILKVIESQGGRRWTLGPESEAFEEELSLAAGTDHAVVVNSGSSALLLAIAALKLPKGSKIIIPAVNFPTAFNAIIQNGHIPVVVDVDINTLNISIDQVKNAIEQMPDIAAIVVVDIAGNPVDVRSLLGVVGSRITILDNCDGFGTLLHGELIDQYFDISCASFHAAHIITTGEGGAIFTSDSDIAQAAHKMREWGRASGTDAIYNYPGFPDDYRERYVYEEIGYNLKPLELQCAMGRIQLKKLNNFRMARLRNYNQLLGIFDKLPTFQVVKNYTRGATPCWFSFPILCRGVKRKDALRLFEENNIETRTIFSGNVLRHPAYRDVDFIQVGHLHNAEDVMHNGLFLSVHPSLTPEMIHFIGEVAKKI